MTTTKSGRYVVFDITDPAFHPGQPIPPGFDTSKGNWFFHPCDWDAPTYGGSPLALLRKYPCPYSPGYASEDEALEEAELWDADSEARSEREQRLHDRLWEGLGLRIGV